jgi:plastocyanin
MPRLKTVLAAAAAIVLLGTLATGPAGADVAAKKKPVKLEGTVNNEGVGKVSGGQVKIEADDFSFEKTFIKGKSGQTVSVEINNGGDTTHTFTIDSLDIDEEISPGDSATVEVTIPKGATRFYCRFHESSGMQGAFFTKSGAKASATSSGSGGAPTTGSSDDSGGGGYGY